MKQFYFSLIFLFLWIFTSHAQLAITNVHELDVTNDTIHVQGSISEDVIKTYIFFSNMGEEPVEVMVRKIEIQKPDGSDCTFCWNDFCFSPDYYETENPIVLPGGATSSSTDFYAEFWPGNQAGVSLIKFEFFNNREEFETVSVVLKITIDDATQVYFPPAITRWELRDARPNPARDHTVVGFAIPSGSRSAQLVVRNLVGNIVFTQNLEPNSTRTRINTQNLANGIYIYSLVIDNQVVSSKRLVVSN
ncbi:MAG: T9SS type A sorting domain-containing protein [Bacteroidales bacterium]